MATSKTFLNCFQNEKYGMYSLSTSKDMEVTQDMHLKMSKKIAQLTKVIYALNTRNDEHEVILKSVFDQHEKEKQRFLMDMEVKFENFKSRLDGQLDYKKNVEVLQSRVAELEKRNRLAEKRLSDLNAECEEREKKLENQYNDNLQGLTNEVARTKHDFENNLQCFEKCKMDEELSHSIALQGQEARYVKEIKSIRNFQHTQDSGWLNRCTEMLEKFEADVSTLKEQLATCQADKLQREEEHATKLKTVKAFFHNEMEALKQNVDYPLKQELDNMRRIQETSKKEFHLQETMLREKINGLVEELSKTGDSCNLKRQEVRELRSEVASLKTVSNMLTLAENEAKETRNQLLVVESQLDLFKERYAVQDYELLEKSSRIAELEITNKELSQDLSSTMNKAIKEVIDDNVTLVENYEREISKLKRLVDESIDSSKAELEARLSAAERGRAEERERDRRLAADVLMKTKQKMQSEFSEERLQLQYDFGNVALEHEKMMSHLLGRCQQAEDEISNLRQTIKASENGLGNASADIKTLNAKTSAVNVELDKAKKDLKAARTQSSNLKAELEKATIVHNGRYADLQMELKQRQETLTDELDAKWRVTMSDQCERVKVEMQSQVDKERQAAVERVSRLMEEQFAVERSQFEWGRTLLEKQLSDLQAEVEQTRLSSQDEMSQLRALLEDGRHQYGAGTQQSSEAHALEVEQLEAKHADHLTLIASQMDADKSKLEEDLRKKHQEEISASALAHSAALNAAQKSAEVNVKMHLTNSRTLLQAQHDLQRTLESKMEQLRASHGVELRAARTELDEVSNVSNQKGREHQLAMDGLRGEITRRDALLCKLKNDFKEIRASSESLKARAADKENLLILARERHSEQLCQVEQRLKQDHKTAMEELTSEHADRNQEMLGRFDCAQSLMKNKISELQDLLSETEKCYNNRDSRPQDLELIRQLREGLKEREMRLKHIMEEKRYYQLELVNRETNFNKVFNTTPNVGVLNPFHGSTKPMRTGGKVLVSKQLDNSYAGTHVDTKRTHPPLPPAPPPVTHSPPLRSNPQPMKCLPKASAVGKKFVR